MATRTQVENKRRRQATELARTEDGYVPTPAVVAEELLSYPFSPLAGLPDGATVVEPSAGTGRLVRAILDADPALRVVAVEPDAGRAAALDALAGEHDPGTVAVVRGTFEDYAAAMDPGTVAAVIMNPPFSAVGNPRLWLSHVLLGWRLLRPGGRLAAILPHTAHAAGWVPPTAAGRRWRDLVDKHGGVRELHADRAAVRAGFPAKVAVMWLAKPMPTRTSGRPTWVLEPAPGEPLDVARLDVGPVSALETPVQRYPDWAYGGRRRVIRYAGTCHGCHRLLWDHDDEQDAQMWSTSNGINPPAGMVGPVIGLCIECSNTDATVDAAERAARDCWRLETPDVAGMVDAAGLSRRLHVNPLRWSNGAGMIGSTVQVIGINPSTPGPVFHFDDRSGWSMAGRQVDAEIMPALLRLWGDDPHGYPDDLIDRARRQTAAPAPA